MDDKKVLELLSKFYNINFYSIKLQREGGCISYYVWDGSDKYFLKLIPSTFMNTSKQSLDILMYLDEKGFPVPRIILTKYGLSHIEVDDLDGKIMFVLFEYIDGNDSNEGEDVQTIGELVGQLHNIMASYQGKLQVNDKDYFINRYIKILKQKNYDANKIEIFQEYGNTLWKRVEHLPRGFCHGDLHRGNLLKISCGKYYVLDFDTSCNAFPIYDIMIMCNTTDYFNFNEEGFHKTKETYESFLKGYTKYCTLNDSEISAFYDLIAIYHYQLQATIIEIYGINCVDNKFLDNQLDWLMKWRKQCESLII